MNIRQSIVKSLVSLAIAVTALMLTACGGGDSDTAAATPDPAAAATPSTSSSTFAGTYTGNTFKLISGGAINYAGPLSITVIRDVTGNYTVSGNWNVTRGNSAGPLAVVNDILSGTVSSAGAFSATGNINVRSMSGTVDAATGKITGTYTYAGSAGDFTGDFSVTK